MEPSEPTANVPESTEQPRKIAGIIIVGHAFQHIYADGFLILLPFIYAAFGMTPITGGLFSMIRQAASGLMTMGGGFAIDTFSGRRGLLLASSLFLMGFGYMMIAAAPNYVVLLIMVGIGAAAGSFWHPIGLGILSTSFPQRRALMMAIHRSAGNIGELITPLVVAAALVAITWRQVLVAGFFLITGVAIAIYLILNRLGLQSKTTEKRSAGSQMKAIGHLFKERTLPILLLVSGTRGAGDRAFVFFLPLFVTREVQLANPGLSFADAALKAAPQNAALFSIMSAMAIVIPPLLALVADRTGRKPVMLGSLIASSMFLAALWWVGKIGWQFTALIAVFGAFRFAVVNLTQAVSLDLAEGKRLEGSMIGLLWGNNATFGALSPLLLGMCITAFAVTENEYQMLFSYTLVMNLLATAAAFFLPNTGRPDRTITANIGDPQALDYDSLKSQ
jgi:MFS family permease